MSGTKSVKAPKKTNTKTKHDQRYFTHKSFNKVKQGDFFWWNVFVIRKLERNTHSQVIVFFSGKLSNSMELIKLQCNVKLLCSYLNNLGFKFHNFAFSEPSKKKYVNICCVGGKNHIHHQDISPLPFSLCLYHSWDHNMCNHAQYFITGCITTTYSYSECMHVSKHLIQ